MKLRLPHLLLSALVAAQMCTTATADTVIASGVSYDVGKVSPKYSGVKADGYNDDALHCWATSASNVIQNWQDKYSRNATSSLPNGVIDSPAGSAEGTANLAVYKTILANSGTVSQTSHSSDAFNWWFKNTASGDVLASARPEGEKYYSIFDGKDAATTVDGASERYFNGDDIKSIFAKSDGNAVSLTITQYAPLVGNEEGRFHSIACWGYETDKDGNVSAVFLSDSDDLSYGIFKANTQYGARYNGVNEYYQEEPGYKLEGLYFDTDDKHDGYNGNFEVVVSKAETINTPTTAVLNDGAYTTAASAPDADGKVTKNTTLAATTEISDKGVSVGSGKEGKLVMLTSENGKELKLMGNGAATSGLSVEHGSLASLDTVSISGYNGSGVELEGRGYLHDGTVSIKDNHATDGGAVKTSTYLEIEGNTKVDISGNTASNKGGGIYNGKDGIVSIFGNTEVTFSNNTAANGGSDIYNAKDGIVNIYNNDKVEFKSSGAAVRNEGELYVAAQAGHDVTFTGSSLDSRGGKTYVGTDLSGDATDSQGGVKFTNEEGTKTLSVTAASDPVNPRTPEYQGSIIKFFSGYEQRTPATLENVSISVQEIAGAGAAKSSVTGAQIISNDDLNVSRLTIDNSSTLTAAKTLNVNNVVIKLTDVTYTKEDNTLTYDLSGTLTASSVAMNNLVFDTDGLELGADDKVVVNLGSSPLQGTARLLTSDGLRDQVKLENGAVYFSGDTELVPEPATATLSLLALAALAARRKRR